MDASTNAAELLASVVSVAMTNRNSNLALRGYVCEYLDTREIPYRNGTDTVGGCRMADIPPIVRGTVHIAQAHLPDEWTAQAQPDARDTFIHRLVDRVLV
jgi:hypothetical protein